MNNPFRIGENWSLAMGRQEGLPMIVRKNNWCDQIAPDPNYPLRCGISVNFREASPNGLPAPSEQTLLEMLEERLIDLCHGPSSAILCLVITTNGFREFVLYARESKEFKTVLSHLEADFSGYLFNSYLEVDPKWEGYLAF